ncbi:MAG: restriction endonuclease subunit S, partial [Eubacterium sp.]|nr:restriction endonuclease subunit S [Eubacterium sp.]
MENAKKNVPDIRFPGFTDPWEQRKLGDVADVTKLAGFEFTEHVVYSDTGNIIALRGLNVKNGQLVLDDVKYIDGSNLSKLSRSKLYANDIMFTYVGTVGEVAIINDNDRFYLAPNVSRIRVQSNDSPRFVSHYMRSEMFYRTIILPLIATSSQPALSMENIRKFVIDFPEKIDEQIKIAAFFDQIDNLITLHQCKYYWDHTGIFTYIITLGPAYFTATWEQRKLGELYSERNEKGNDTLQILSVSIHSGVSDGELDSESLGKNVRRSEDKTKYKHVYPGDLIFNMMRAWQGAIGVAKNEGMISPAYISAIPNNEVFPLFMDYS